jgi:REP element-mobilizing transposase RayT
MSRVFHALCYHFVWSTKGRVTVFTSSNGATGSSNGYATRQRSEKVPFSLQCDARSRSSRDNGSAGHRLCRFIGMVKGASSFGFNREWAPPTEKVLDWQDGYGVFSLRLAGRAEVVRYVENHEQIHRDR